LSIPTSSAKTFAGPSFWTWRTVAKLVDGIALSELRELDLFEQCTGLAYDRHSRRKVRRLLLLCGRRAGKNRFMSAVAVWRPALCTDWRQHQSDGEGSVCILLGADKRQARILRNYCEGLLECRCSRPERATSASWSSSRTAPLSKSTPTTHVLCVGAAPSQGSE
jgi:hypothetical protein